jgi:hypothetical protein
MTVPGPCPCPCPSTDTGACCVAMIYCGIRSMIHQGWICTVLSVPDSETLGVVAWDVPKADQTVSDAREDVQKYCGGEVKG